jgi:hypothetical protein
MLRRTQPGVSPGVKCVLLFLMFAVFVWGLHTKLSHYSASMSSSNSGSVTAKLLTDKTVEHSADAHSEEAANNPGLKIEVPAFTAVPVVPFPQIELYQVELNLCSSCRYDLDGPNQMHLPPPAIS